MREVEFSPTPFERPGERTLVPIFLERHNLANFLKITIPTEALIPARFKKNLKGTSNYQSAWSRRVNKKRSGAGEFERLLGGNEG